MSQKELYLLDGNSLTYRAFYALPTTLTKSDGTITNAVFGFTKMLLTLIDNEAPDSIGVAFDVGKKTFRHQAYEDYKGTREKTPDELRPQFKLVKDVLEALQIPFFGMEEYEADDLIGTLAKRAEAEGYQVTIVTGDRDALQLISDNIRVMYTRRGITDIVDYTLEKFREDYELEPIQLIDKKGLMGDSSDNIPGVDGIGDKTSTKLLKEFGTLEKLLENIDKVGGKKRKATLEEQADRARMSKELATIKLDVPIDIDFESLKISDFNNEEAYQLFNDLEFTSLISYIGGHKEVKDFSYEEIDSIEDFKRLEVGEKLAINLELSGEKLTRELEHIAISFDDQNYYIDLDENELLEGLREIIAGKELLMLEGKEQIRYLLQHGIAVDTLAFEPLLADYLLKPSEQEKSFAELVQGHLQRALPESDDKELLILKTKLLFDLEEELITKLEENDLLRLYQEVELPLLNVLAELELNGIKVSKEGLEELNVKFKEKIANIEEQIYELAGETFNINSPKQLGVILFENLGLPVIKKTKTGYSTSASVLEKLEGKHEIIPLISQYRTYTKLQSTYVEPLEEYINEETGRIHTTFNQRVTATGRLSSADPNLQNIPIRSEEGREIRDVFVAEEGKKLVAADYSQIELRVLAHISDDEGLKEAYQHGLDIHTKTASEIFDIPLEEVTSNERRKAKAVNFGIAYGISDWGLAKRLNIGNKEAQEFIELYFSRYPKVKEYMDNTIKQAKEEGYVTTVFNRKRYLSDINSKNYHKREFAKRMAINTPIQGSAADIMKIATIDVANALKEEKLNAKVLLQVHDELVLEVPEDELEMVQKLVKEKMEEAVQLDVKLEVDVKVGDSWNNME
ncbi:DNA polymerase I [Orenia metallireducens]|uniref:DNA polymerase I n=1 Tax=Orenia metallireducens TaxID=1413210 RepID=A0A285GT05_9FIRM|nr:DNA polymerase I [Orenia metallireducens]PRX32639.1 DNA polymerase I [Orenia metallireducens]SNY26647.1 DNA polymerase I [Orenia metallireducens]